MKLVLHIVRSDAKLWGWTIALWAAFGLCAMAVELSDPPEGSLYFPLMTFSLTVQTLLACALLGWIVQEDSARDPLAFWRSRPIAPGELLTAKLLLLGTLFVAAPLAAFIGIELFQPAQMSGAFTYLRMGIFFPSRYLRAQR